MNIQVLREMLLPFFTALGVLIGGSIMGSLSALITRTSPLQTMDNLARSVKLWAVVVAIGGTFPTIRIIETGIFGGQFLALIRQLLIIICAFAGANAGYWLITVLAGGE